MGLVSVLQQLDIYRSYYCVRGCLLRIIIQGVIGRADIAQRKADVLLRARLLSELFDTSVITGIGLLQQQIKRMRQ